MLICGIRPTLWAPSFRLLEEQKDSSISPQLLIKLVKSGIINIAAREDWILDKDWRNEYKWDYGHWYEKYDGVIREMYRNNHKSVIGFPKPEGRTGIRKLAVDKEREKIVKRKLKNYYNNDLLPDGIYRRIEDKKLVEENEKMNQALFDIYNTEDAVNKLANPILVTAHKTAPVMENIFREPGNRYADAYTDISIELVTELLNYINLLPTIISDDQILKCFKESERIGIAPLLNTYLKSDKKYMKELLSEDNEMGYNLRETFKDIEYKDNNNSILGFITSFAGLKVPEQNRGMNNSLFPNKNRINNYLTLNNYDDGYKKEVLERMRKSFIKLVHKYKSKRSIKTENQLKVFICYKHQNQNEQDELINSIEKSLDHFIKEGTVKLFFDTSVKAGKIDDQILNNLSISHLIIMLIYKNFLSSKYIVEKELPIMIERYNQKQCLLLPILVHKDYSRKKFTNDLFHLFDKKVANEFNNLMYLPEDGVPINKWDEKEKVLENIEITLSEIINDILLLGKYVTI